MGLQFPILVLLLMFSQCALAQVSSETPWADTPQRLKTWAREAEARDKNTGHILLHDVHLELDEAGRFHRWTHRIITLHNEHDVQRWSNLTVSWHKDFESRPDIQARVITPEGTAQALDPSTVVETTVDADEKENESPEQERLLKVQPPGLKPGGILEVLVMEHEHTPRFQAGRYDQLPLRSTLPIDQLQVSFAWHPKRQLRYRLDPAIPLQKTEGKNAAGWPKITLQGKAIAAEAMPDPLSTPDEAGASHLELTSVGSWADAATEYQNIVEKRLSQSKKIPALVRKLKKDRKTAADLLEAITTYVQVHIRTRDSAFGESLIEPQTPDQTVERGQGDGKDKATLAQAMLKEAGFPSHQALLQVAPQFKQSDDMPGLDRFNHVIVAVRKDGGWTWLDPTAEFFKPGLLPPAVAGRKALLIGPESQGLQTLPVSRMEGNQLSISKTFEIPRLGPARMMRMESAKGIFDAFHRRALSAQSAGEFMSEMELVIDQQAELQSATATDPMDLTGPMRLEGRFANVSTIDVWPAGTRFFALPYQLFSGLPAALDPMNERDVKGKIEELKKILEKRQDAVTLNFPFQRDYIFRFHLPPHLEVSAQPEPAHLQLGPASFAVETRSCGKSCLELHYNFATGSSLCWTAAEARDYAEGLGRLMDDKLYAVTIKPRAFVLSENGSLREAIQHARKASQSRDAQAADTLALAQLMNRVGLIEESQQLARAAVKAQPQEKRILLHAAELFIRGANQKDCSKGSDCAEARRLYEAALKLDPTERIALRTMPLLLVHNSKGIRYGRGADLSRADAAFAKAMKGSLADDLEFFNTYLQHLTMTGQWIAMDQALRHPPEAMPPAVASAWKVITLIGNQHPEEAKAELNQLHAREDGPLSMQGLIKELLQDRRYKEASQLLALIGEHLPETKGAAEALAVMETCPEERRPDADLNTSVRLYICTMLSPDSTLKEGLDFVPDFARKDAGYQEYFEKVEWERRLENSRAADPSLPPYFLIDSTSSAYDVHRNRKIRQGEVLVLHQTKAFAASPFAEPIEPGYEPQILAVQDQGVWRFISLDVPSVLSMLWFRAQENGDSKAADDYAGLLGELLDRSMAPAKDEAGLTPEARHYRGIVRNFRPLLKGTSGDQELVAAIYAPDILYEKTVKIMEREQTRSGLNPEQKETLDVLIAGRLVHLKQYQEAYERLLAGSEKGPLTFPMAQTLLQLARSGAIKPERMRPLVMKLEQSKFDERLNLLAEITSLLGEREATEKAYRQWLQKPAPRGLTENNFAWFYFTSGRSNQEALQLAQSANEAAKESVANLNTLASIQAELGMTHDAVTTQMQYRMLLGDRDLGAADELVTAINAEKLGLADAALKRLKKIKVEPATSDLKPLLQAKIHELEKGRRAR